MQAPPGYEEVDVPPHLMKLFNETFQHDFGHCRLFLRDSKGKYSDKDIWAVMVESMDRGIMDEDEDLLDEDYAPRKKITWH